MTRHLHDDSMEWTPSVIGKVTPNGNIVGREPGIAYSAGEVIIRDADAPIAEGHGWRVIGKSEDKPLVTVFRP